MPRVKTSYGLAMCRVAKNGKIEILMIKKRCSYAFVDFVAGKYKKNNDQHLTSLFSGMSYHEKFDILKGDYENMWYKIWLDSPEKPHNLLEETKEHEMDFRSSYFKKKSKFINLCSANSGDKLKRLIKHSSNSENIWEIPKGRKKVGETGLDAAMREFKEETSLSPHYYEVLFHIKPVTEIYTDAGSTYINEYHIVAWNGKDFIPKVKFENKDQVKEIENIGWIQLEQIKFMNMNPFIEKRTIKLFNQISDTFKRYTKDI